MARRPVGYISGIMKQNVIGQAKPQTAAQQVPRDATFGKANRPSTPIQGVISFTYANMAEQEQNEKYEFNSKLAKESRHQKPVPGNTRARELAKQHIMSERERQQLSLQDKFKLRRFTNVEPRTITNRI